jgi:hypothetical protein
VVFLHLDHFMTAILWILQAKTFNADVDSNRLDRPCLAERGLLSISDQPLAFGIWSKRGGACPSIS